MKHSDLYHAITLMLSGLPLLSALAILCSCSNQAAETNPVQNEILTLTDLGLVTSADSAYSWTIESQSQPQKVSSDYEMLIGKRLHCHNEGTETDYTLTDGHGHHQRLEVQQYPDGTVFRYVLAGGYEQPVELLGERSTLTLNADSLTDRWLMRWSDAYEGFYPKNPDEEAGAHWGFPALFARDSTYVLVTEANIQTGHSASTYWSEGQHGSYRIQSDPLDHTVQSGWTSPWRVLITGSLATLVESTLVTDVSDPCQLQDTSWIEPGVVSWVYWAYNHGSNDYKIVCQYIDMAATLHLPYVLIDAEWDEMKNGGNIEDALSYAIKKGVKPIIWYNSTTGWIEGAPTPQYRLNDPEKREAEFQWCEDHGVKGVKIDFFEADKQRCMDYCQELLQAAARHHLTVNFHGATIPRGWCRTWPNLLSTEAVYGAEWYNNRAELTDRAACHNATLPFTRGVIGPMDYTPCTFTDSQHPHITSHAHELALTVLFESGLLHLADRPSAYLSQPQVIQDFLSALPSVWEETRLVSGYPGHHAVLARRRGNVWYVAGINGTDAPLTLSLTWPDGVPQTSSCLSIADNPAALYPSPVKAEAERWLIDTLQALPSEVTLQPRGGFVIKISE